MKETGAEYFRRAMSILIVILLLFLGNISAQTESGHWQACPDNWTQQGTSCYHGNNTAVTLQEADEMCHLHHAHLLFIETRQENDFIAGFLEEVRSPSVWLGARYDRSRQQWVWFGDTGSVGAHHSQVEFNMWSYGQAPPGGEQYCSNAGQDGWWNFANCSATLPFVCEKTRGCDPGWYNEDCTAQCHCRGSGACRQEDGLCPKGCADGWTGTSCDTENPMPDATFHCYQTSDNDLQADLTVDIKGRQFSVIQAVSEQGEPLACNLPKVRHQSNKLYLTLLLPGAFADVNDTSDVTDAEDTSLVTTSSSPDVTSRDGVTERDGEASSAANSSADGEVPSRSVRSSPSEGNSTQKSSSGDECIASRAENGSVTWLIEFKEFPDVLTGNDVTVEVTCDLNDADSLESVDSVVDDSEQGEPVAAAMLPVVTSVFLTDCDTGQQVQHFHLGQRLQLHVDIKGLTDKECGFPHSCMLRTGDGEGQEVVLLDGHGCGEEYWPIRELHAEDKGHFVSEDFPALSLGGETVQVTCQVHVQLVADPRQCQRSCRDA